MDWIAATWAALSGNHTAGLRVRDATDVEMPAGKPLFAVDGDGLRHVLLPVPIEYSVTQDKTSAGVHILSHELIDEMRRRRFVDVVCLKPHLNDVFSLVAREIIDAVRQDSSSPDRTCHRVLSRWRELLSREAVAGATHETLTGLYGELLQLREIVRRDPTRTATWVGYAGSRHDFVGRDISLEVKATMRRGGWTCQISGVDQLHVAAGAKLYLVLVRLEPSSDALSLDDIKNELVELGADAHVIMNAFLSLGVTTDQAVGARFRVIESRMYVVNEAFPRITRQSFIPGGLPDRVVRLQYELDLAGDNPLPLTSQQIELVFDALAS